MAQVAGLLPSTWKNWIGFLPPGFSLGPPDYGTHLGNKLVDGRSICQFIIQSFILSLSLPLN